MKRMRFGDLEPGTIWRGPGDEDWWLKVDAEHVYSSCGKTPSKDRGWSIKIVDSGSEDCAGILYWTSNNSEVDVWDGKEELK